MLTASELGLCLASVLCSSSSQLFIKSATARPRSLRSLLLLGVGGGLQLSSILLVVVALRTMRLSQLTPFAAIAYLLVPIGSHVVFKERLLPRFWAGALLIVIGVLYINS